MKDHVNSLMLIVTVALAGCGDTSNLPPLPEFRPTLAPDEGFVATAEPPGAVGVIALRNDAKDGQEVVVVGRIGGSGQPIVKGRAAFTIVDLSLEPCCLEDEPWTFCCTAKDELAKGTVLVRFTDEHGKTLARDARGLLGIKEMQTVVVRGKARRDADGNLTVEAVELFVRPQNDTE